MKYCLYKLIFPRKLIKRHKIDILYV